MKYCIPIFKSVSIFLVVTILISSCKNESNFQHDQTSESLPWTHENFDDDKFTFAIFSDLTGGERAGVFEVAVAQLNILRPDMIVNVGDLIEGDYSNLIELSEEWNYFDQRANKARAPLFYVGGNHDLANEEMWQVWDERYGRRYYHFVYKDVLFLILNTEDNSLERSEKISELRVKAIELIEKEGMDVYSQTEYANLPEQKAGNLGDEQVTYFEQVIAKHSHVKWTFLFMHKAAWKRENSNFEKIELALENMPYTVFNGHQHAYEYELRNGRDYIRLATTGGAQIPEKGLSADQLMLVTVDNHGVDIVNILMSGILDKTGHIPKGGDTLCFEKARCD